MPPANPLRPAPKRRVGSGGSLRRRPVAGLVVAALGSVAGIAAAQSPGRVVPPVVFTIESRLPGATAAVVAERVASPIERAVRTLPAVRSVHSQSSTGRTIVEVAFDTAEPPDRIAARIDGRLATMRPPLPEGASRPTVAWSRDRTESR